MTRRPHKIHTLAFKSEVALEAIKGEKILSELVQQFEVHTNQIKLWRDQVTILFVEAFSRPSLNFKKNLSASRYR
ncbi:MAG: hypothetical protein GY927_01790 [bacterium]|nr:hypothetical protein [bacterium]